MHINIDNPLKIVATTVRTGLLQCNRVYICSKQSGSDKIRAYSLPH